MKTSLRSEMVRLAYNLGYRVTEVGAVVSRKGRDRKLGKSGAGNSRPIYSTFNVKVPASDCRYPVPVHKLVAFQKFGEAALGDYVVVRHLNGDSLDNRPNNIAIGTQSDNERDRPVVDRKRHAQLAGLTNARPPEFWSRVAADHQAGLGYKTLGKKYGLSLGTLSYRLSKTGKRTKMAD